MGEPTAPARGGRRQTKAANRRHRAVAQTPTATPGRAPGPKASFKDLIVVTTR